MNHNGFFSHRQVAAALHRLAAHTNRRRLSAWVLLCVFVPMLVLSAFHIHTASASEQTTCAECVSHHCGGHLGQSAGTLHTCVLCQFLTLQYVAAAVCMVAMVPRAGLLCRSCATRALPAASGGIASLRAPPYRPL